MLLRPDGSKTAWLALRAETIGNPPPNTIAVRGALITDPGGHLGESPRPITLRRNARSCCLLGAQPGEIEQPVQPTSPHWLCRADLDPGRYEATPGFEVVWIVYNWGAGWWEARVRPTRPPSAASSASGLVAQWAQAFLEAEPGKFIPADADTLWTAYKTHAATVMA